MVLYIFLYSHRHHYQLDPTQFNGIFNKKRSKEQYQIEEKGRNGKLERG